MSAVIVTLHIIVSISLIVIVLLQHGKGADVGAVFGGSSDQTLFGPRGAATALSKITIASAVIFMVTSLTLAFMAMSPSGDSIMQSGDIPASEAPLDLKISEDTILPGDASATVDAEDGTGKATGAGLFPAPPPDGAESTNATKTGLSTTVPVEQKKSEETFGGGLSPAPPPE